MLFAHACRAHNDLHGVSVRAMVSGYISKVSAKNNTAWTSTEMGLFLKAESEGYLCTKAAYKKMLNEEVRGLSFIERSLLRYY